MNIPLSRLVEVLKIADECLEGYTLTDSYNLDGNVVHLRKDMVFISLYFDKRRIALFGTLVSEDKKTKTPLYEGSIKDLAHLRQVLIEINERSKR